MQSRQLIAAGERLELGGQENARDRAVLHRALAAGNPRVHEEEHAQGEDEDERTDKQPGIEVQGKQQGAQPSAHAGWPQKNAGGARDVAPDWAPSMGEFPKRLSAALRFSEEGL